MALNSEQVAETKDGFDRNGLEAIALLVREYGARVTIPCKGVTRDALESFCRLLEPVKVRVRHVQFAAWLDGPSMAELPERLIFDCADEVVRARGFGHGRGL